MILLTVHNCGDYDGTTWFPYGLQSFVTLIQLIPTIKWLPKMKHLNYTVYKTVDYTWIYLLINK